MHKFFFRLFSSKPSRLEIDIDKFSISELSIQSFQTKDWEWSLFTDNNIE